MATHDASMWLSVIIVMLVIFPEAYGKKETIGSCSSTRRDFLNKHGSVLDEHNYFRCKIRNRKKNVPDFQWKNSLEMSAKARAEKCTEHHESDKNHIQQLVVMDSRFTNPVQKMYKEYKTSQRKHTGNKNVLQMVWEQSSKIGCGSHDCNGLIHHVCHYGSTYSQSPEKRTATSSVVTQGRSVANNCEEKYGGFPEKNDYSTNDRYLKEHNFARCKIRRGDVFGPGKYVTDFQWDSSLAHRAQLRAQRCTESHEMDITNYVVWSGDMYYSPVKAIFDVYEKYARGNTGYSSSQKLPLTKMVWEQSRSLGCGSHKCDETIYHVCLYGPIYSESLEKRTTTSSVVTEGRSVANSCEEKYGGFPEKNDYSKQGRFLDEHNYVRCMVRTGRIPGLPKGPYVQDLQWDRSLENSATRSARTCYTNHGRGISYGENIDWSSNKFDSPMKAWYYEYKRYRYGLIDHTGSTELHLTQMLWENTTKVGCGSHQCHRWMLYFCHYAPKGNMPTEYPYRRK